MVVDSKLKVLDQAIKVADIRSRLLKCQNKTDSMEIQKDLEMKKQQSDARVKEARKNADQKVKESQVTVNKTK